MYGSRLADGFAMLYGRDPEDRPRHACFEDRLFDKEEL